MLRFNDQNLDLKVLVEVEVSTSETLYFSNKHCVVSDRFYEGRIISEVIIDEQLQSFDRPVSVRNSVVIDFSNANTDGTFGFFDDLLNVYNFYNKVVTIWVGDGTDKTADFEQQFKGVIQFPDGILRHDRNTFAIEVADLRQRNDLIIPKNKYSYDQYPNLEEKSLGKYIPIVYGNWGTISVGTLKYPRVNVACIDITNNTFKIADHPIEGIDGIYRNGVLLVDGTDYVSADFDVDKATFILNDYEDNTETITVDCRGKKYNQYAAYGDDEYGVGGYGVAGNMKENPIDILEDILLEIAEIPEADRDSVTFDALTTELSGYKIRRQISEGITLPELLAEMSFELGVVLSMTKGQYSIHNFYPDFTWKLLNPVLFTETDIVSNSFSVQQDVEKVYANRISARYSYHPGSVSGNENDKFLRIATNSDFDAINNVGTTYEQFFNFMWLHQDNDVSNIVDNYLRFFGSEEPVDLINVQFLFRGLNLELNEVIRLTYGKYTERECKIAGLKKNLAKGKVDAKLYAFPDTRHAGLLTDDFQIDGAVADDGGSQTDETTAAQNDTIDDVTLLPATPVVNDAYYAGYLSQKFDTVYFDISTPGVGTWTITWEYYDGTTWSSLENVTDNTSGFTARGINSVTFDVPSDWTITAVNQVPMYWIRGRVSSYSAVTTQPTGKMVFMPMLFPSYLGAKSMDVWDTDWTTEQKLYAKSKALYLCDDAGFVVAGDDSSKDLWGWA